MCKDTKVSGENDLRWFLPRLDERGYFNRAAEDSQGFKRVARPPKNYLDIDAWSSNRLQTEDLPSTPNSN